MAEMYRQGDLLFIRINELPKRTKKRTSDVILKGEATGHSHRLVGGQILVEYWPFLRGEERLIMVVPQEAKVVHEEHATIVIPEGFWRVQRQREFSPEKNYHVLD